MKSDFYTEPDEKTQDETSIQDVGGELEKDDDEEADA